MREPRAGATVVGPCAGLAEAALPPALPGRPRVFRSVVKVAARHYEAFDQVRGLRSGTAREPSASLQPMSSSVRRHLGANWVWHT